MINGPIVDDDTRDGKVKSRQRNEIGVDLGWTQMLYDL